MARLNNEDINRVRQSANITEVISQYLPIEKKGRNFVALCPFHEDSNPSMTISEDKQIYKCFVCGAGGNVFTFVSKFTNVSFIQAVKEVADFVNIPLDIPDYTKNVTVNREHEHLYQIMQDATDYMHFKLINSQDQMINDYVKLRGLSEDDLNYFDVGYESDHSLVNFLNKKGYENETLQKINLINEGDYGVRSVFNNRLLFPIHTSHGDVVGYSGRAIIEDDNIAKYINSNENIIYTKGDVLYNYHRAKDIAKQEGVIYLVEGVMDVIGFYKAGVLNAVATLGTALTENQAKLLKTLSNNVVLSYDGDSAGRLATVKAIDILLKHNFTIEVLNGFDNLDPDDYLKEYGKERFQKAVLERLGYLDFLIAYNKGKYNLDNFEERKEFTITLTNYVEFINNDFDRDYFMTQISKLTNFNKSQIEKLRVPKREIISQPVVQRKVLNVKNNRAEYNIIGQMMSGKRATMYIRDNLGFLTDNNLYNLYLIIVEYYFNNDELKEADLITLINQVDENLSDVFLEIINNDTIIKEYNKDIIDENISLIEAKLIDENIKRLRHTPVFDEKEQAEVLKEITDLYRKKSEILGK